MFCTPFPWQRPTLHAINSSKTRQYCREPFPGDHMSDPEQRKIFCIGKKNHSGPVRTMPKNLKTAFSLWKRIKCFPSTLRRRNVKPQQTPVISDLCLRKTRAGKSHDGREVIVSKSSVFKMFSVPTKTQSRRFQILPVWRAFSKSSVFMTD